MAPSSEDALEKASESISIRLRRHESNFLGAIVFGSLAKGTWRKNSDVDIMLLFDECDYSRSVSFKDGFKFEVYSMPLKMFFAPFSGDERNLFFDMFRLQVMRSGKIIYERGHLLSQLSAKLRGQEIPRGYLDEVLNRAHSQINAAKRYLCEGRMEKAELKLRDASINLARALLMKTNIPEINTPRLIIPHLREKFPELCGVLREICGLNSVGKDEVEARIGEVKEMLNIVRRKLGKNAGLKGVIEKAENELLSAEDLSEIGDRDSAMLQAEFAQSILMKKLPVRINRLTYTFTPRSLKKDEIKEYVQVLKEMEDKYF